MKKYVLSIVALMIASTGFSQMSDKGYLDLKLGMSVAQAKKVIPFKFSEETEYSKEASIVYNGVPLELSFQSNGNGPVLWKISSYSPKVKVKGFTQELVGKKYAAVKAVLGAKMKFFDIGGEGFDAKNANGFFLFYVDKSAQENEETSCILEFEDGILVEILSSYNP